MSLYENDNECTVLLSHDSLVRTDAR